MKNKITYIILALIVNFAYISTAYCQPLVNDGYWSLESYTEIPTSDTSKGYRYVSLGVGPIIFIPNIGIGYRKRYSQFGWDTALSFSTIGYAHQLSGHFVGHYYLSPLDSTPTYLGLGVIGSGVITNQKKGGVTLSPDFVFGKEFIQSDDSRHFVEMHVAVPSLWMNKRIGGMYFPLMYIKYGISF